LSSRAGTRARAAGGSSAGRRARRRAGGVGAGSGGGTRLLDVECLRTSEDLGRVGTVDEVDDIACIDAESDVSHGERAIAGIKVACDGKGTIEERGVRVGDGNVDGVGVTRGKRPVDDIGSILNPESVWARTGNSESQRRSGESKSGDGFEQHFPWVLGVCLG